MVMVHRFMAGMAGLGIALSRPQRAEKFLLIFQLPLFRNQEKEMKIPGIEISEASNSKTSNYHG